MAGSGARVLQRVDGTGLTLGIVATRWHGELVDHMLNRAVEAGATVRFPLADQFWGDRYGQLVDPFGHTWSVASKIKG